MYTASEVIAKSTRDVLTIGPGATILDAARIMNENRVGALIVVDEGGGGGNPGGLVGIITERDVLRKIVAKSVDPTATLVADAMTPDVYTCRPESRLTEVKAVMDDKKIRHLPIVDDENILGMVSITDAIHAEIANAEVTIKYLEQYMHKG